MSTKARLWELVQNALPGTPSDVALGALSRGLTEISTAISDAQERRGNWGPMIVNLKRGREQIDVGLAWFRKHPDPGVATLVALAERMVALADDMRAIVQSDQEGESTLV